MKRANNADSLKHHSRWNEKWALVVYGDPLFKSKAVQVLEIKSPTPGLWHSLVEQPPDEVMSDLLEDDGVLWSGDPNWIPAGFRRALNEQDFQFFTDLAAAIKRRNNPKLKNHFLIMRFYMQIENDLRLKKRDVPTYAELREIAPGADVSTIALELDIVVRLEKRGPTSRKKKSET